MCSIHTDWQPFSVTENSRNQEFWFMRALFLDSYEKQIILNTCTNKKINFIFLTSNVIFINRLYAVCSEYFEVIVNHYLCSSPNLPLILSLTLHNIQSTNTNCWTVTFELLLSCKVSTKINCWIVILSGKVSTNPDCKL